MKRTMDRAVQAGDRVAPAARSEPRCSAAEAGYRRLLIVDPRISACAPHPLAMSQGLEQIFHACPHRGVRKTSETGGHVVDHV